MDWASDTSWKNDIHLAAFGYTDPIEVFLKDLASPTFWAATKSSFQQNQPVTISESDESDKSNKSNESDESDKTHDTDNVTTSFQIFSA
ncbi:4996_t:CDS:2, partial [Racocetra persica]